MRGYNFTERVRKVLEMAREEAGRLKHEYLGTEHILLGLVSEGEGVAAAVLQNLQIDLDDVRESIERHVKKGIRADVGRDLPYTTRAKKVLELAMDEAGLLHHEYVGTEHLLLGLVREERGIAAQVLTSLGADLDSVRRETLRLLGAEMPQSREPTARRVESHTGRPALFTIRIDYEGGSWSKNTFERAGDAIEFLRTYESPGSNGDDESAGATGPP
jgi:ATP-dependent Clp protease ATP-binding subunit ClpC